jgi:hypothetical protein
MHTWILIVYLLTTDPPKVFATEKFASKELCEQWINFYSEYPFRPVCIQEL